MTRLLLPAVAAVPGTVEPEPVHLIPEGHVRCLACGASKFQMRLKYTDEAAMWQMFCGTEGFAMYDPVDRMMKPYYTCRSEHGHAQ